MIKTIAQHKEYIQATKEKVYGEGITVEGLQNNFIVSIQSEPDILFANLNKYHLFEEENLDRNNSFYKDLLYNQLLNEVDLNYHPKYLTEEVVRIKEIRFSTKTQINVC